MDRIDAVSDVARTFPNLAHWSETTPEMVQFTLHSTTVGGDQPTKQQSTLRFFVIYFSSPLKSKLA